MGSAEIYNTENRDLLHNPQTIKNISVPQRVSLLKIPSPFLPPSPLAPGANNNAGGLVGAISSKENKEITGLGEASFVPE